MNTIKGLHFQPWKGENYGNSRYGKLLLLGESHYFKDKEDDINNLTSLVIRNHIDGTGKSPFFRKAGYAFNRSDWRNIWNNIAYANLIQVGLKNSKSQPTIKQRSTINLAFKLLLNSLKPEKVIILSKRMWENWLPEDGWGKEKIASIHNKEKSTEVWEYKYVGGRCLVIGTCHPSSRWFSSGDYTILINKFISMKY